MLKALPDLIFFFTAKKNKKRSLVLRIPAASKQ